MIKPAAQAKRSLRRCTTLGALLLLTGLSVGCLCPCGPISCDAWPYADAWVDADCDGEREYDEAPLEGVCVWSARRPDGPPWAPEYCTWPYGRTNDDGRWQGDLVSGCLSSYYVVAQTPPGFVPTTDTVVGDQMYVEFGFAPAATCPGRLIVTPARLAAAQRSTHLQRVLVCALPVLVALILLGVGALAGRKNTTSRDLSARH